MVQKPLFSIIMATYNRAHLLRRAISSVLNQTYQDFELIVVDDGSTDGTEGEVRSFKSEKLRYRKQTRNKGMLAARNMGFDLSKGKYIALLDDDDELLPWALETAVNEFSKLPSNGVGMIWFNCIDSKTRKLTGKGVSGSGYISYKDDLCGKVHGNFWEIINSDLMGKDARFDERLWGGESMFWFRIHRRTKVFYVHKALRMNHTGSNTVSTAENQLKHVPRIVLTARVFLENYGNLRRRLCPKKYGHDLAALGFWQILNGEKLEGRKTLVEAFKYARTLSFVLLMLSVFFDRNHIMSLYPRVLKVRETFLTNH